MKRLFIKEFNQGRPLLVFALAMALVLPAAYAMLAGTSLFPFWELADVEFALGFLLLALPPVIAALAGAGLFSSEAERGTLPVLFALPLSRARIWWAKILAGLVLTAVGSAILLGLNAFLLTGVYRRLPIMAYLPDVCLWTAFAFAAAAFWSTVAPNVIASLAGAAVLGGGLVGGVVALWYYLGAPLLEAPVALDIALWASVFAPLLLLLSAVAVIKGELLQSAWNRVFPFPLLLVGAVITIAVTVGVARWATGYQRSKVAQVQASEVMQGARAASLIAYPRVSRLALVRAIPLVEREGLWRLLVPGSRSRIKSVWAAPLEQRGIYAPAGGGPTPGLAGRCYAVVLDLRSGRELMVRPLPEGHGIFSFACSRDGRFAAVVSRPLGLTSGEIPWRKPTLQIIDLARQKVVYEGLPGALGGMLEMYSGAAQLSWSASGDYLAVGTGGGLWLVLHREGRPIRAGALRFEQLVWHPRLDLLLGLTAEAKLVRVGLDGRPPKVLYSPDAKQSGYGARLREQDLSPDGAWVALEEWRGEAPDQTFGLRLVRTDGSGSRLLWEGRGAELIQLRDPGWSSDGAALYVLISRPEGASRWRRRFQVHLWRPGEGSLRPIGPEIVATWAKAAPRPASDELAVWAERLAPPTSRSRFGVRAARVFLLNSRGERREIGSPKLVSENHLLGFDDQGRMIVGARDQSCLRAFDLASGRMRRLYP
jgi:ABC-type transport system involved in multi-copper enzyme maturation permease subunit